MKIEEIKDEDIKGCLDIYNYYIENTTITLEEELLDEVQYKNRVDNITKKYPFLVLKDNDEVIGFVYLSSFNERSGYRYSADLSIYLHHKRTKEHLGALMLAQIEQKAKEMGITNLVSIITSANIPSLKFHAENGFVEEGKLHNIALKFGQILDVSYYRKAL